MILLSLQIWQLIAERVEIIGYLPDTEQAPYPWRMACGRVPFVRFYASGEEGLI